MLKICDLHYFKKTVLDITFLNNETLFQLSVQQIEDESIIIKNLFANSISFLQCKENQKLGAVYFHLHFIMYLSSILCVIRNVIHACVYRLSLLCHCRKIVKSEIRKEGNLNENGKNEFGKEYNCTTSLVNSTKLQLLFYQVILRT